MHISLSSPSRRRGKVLPSFYTLHVRKFHTFCVKCYCARFHVFSQHTHYLFNPINIINAHVPLQKNANFAVYKLRVGGYESEFKIFYKFSKFLELIFRKLLQIKKIEIMDIPGFSRKSG